MPIRRVIYIFLTAAVLGCGGGPSGPLPSLELAEYGPPAVAIQKLSGAPEIRGVMVSGQPGDWLLQNERVSVVVSAVGRRHGFAKSGGNVVDAAPAGGEDTLAELFTYFDDTWPRQAIYTQLTQDAPNETTRVITVTGHDSFDPALLVKTSYILAAGSSSLRIETQMVNTGQSVYSEFELGDAVEWGRTIPFVPGTGRGLAGKRTRSSWLAADGEGTAYLLSGPSEIQAVHGEEWSDPSYKSVAMAPGDTVRYQRDLVVVPGSVAEAARELALDVSGTFFLQVGSAENPVEGAEVSATNSRGLPVMSARSRPRRLGSDVAASGQV